MKPNLKLSLGVGIRLVRQVTMTAADCRVRLIQFRNSLQTIPLAY
jgi:hypothetical protein